MSKTAKEGAARAKKRSGARASDRAEGLSLIARTAARARAENARKARELIAVIEAKTAQIEECFYEIGVALQGLRTPAVWSAAGAESFESLVETRLPGLGLALAYRLLRIADHYEERTAIALTQSKALALLTYVDATPEADDAESLARQDAIVGGKRISEQTVRGILEAATEARPASRRRKREGEDEARAQMRALAKRIEAATDEPVSFRLVYRKGKPRIVADLPAEIAAVIGVTKRRRAATSRRRS